MPNKHEPNTKKAWAKYHIGMSQIPKRHEPNTKKAWAKYQKGMSQIHKLEPYNYLHKHEWNPIMYELSKSEMLFGYFYIIIMPWGLNIQDWLGSWAD